MAYRELIMIEVREILRRLLDEQGLRRIARETSVDRKTVTRYSLAAVAAGLTRGTALTDESRVAPRLTDEALQPARRIIAGEPREAPERALDDSSVVTARLRPRRA